jgi:hypothetical protein
MAVMIITGDSLSLLMRDKTLQNALYEIHGEAARHGGLEHHVLCVVRTPLSRRHNMEFVRHHHSQMALHSAIQAELAEQSGGYTYLDTKCIDLDGWSHTSSSLPQCCIERSSGERSNLTMKFVWASGAQHSATIVV